MVPSNMQVCANPQHMLFEWDIKGFHFKTVLLVMYLNYKVPYTERPKVNVLLAAFLFLSLRETCFGNACFPFTVFCSSTVHPFTDQP